MLEENWYRAGQLLPGAMIRCIHGTNSACACVIRFNVDKNCPLTGRQVIVAAASLELNRMKRLDIEDDRKYSLLNLITQCQEGEQDSCIEEYKLLYAPLVPNKTVKVPEPDLPIHPQNYNILSIFLLVFIMLITLPMRLML
jgi:hypothetical protein